MLSHSTWPVRRKQRGRRGCLQPGSRDSQSVGPKGWTFHSRLGPGGPPRGECPDQCGPVLQCVGKDSSRHHGPPFHCSPPVVLSVLSSLGSSYTPFSWVGRSLSLSATLPGLPPTTELLTCFSVTIDLSLLDPRYHFTLIVPPFE